MSQAIIQAPTEAAKLAVMTVKQEEDPARHAIPLQMMPVLGSPALKQSTFNWKVPDKYQEEQI